MSILINVISKNELQWGVTTNNPDRTLLGAFIESNSSKQRVRGGGYDSLQVTSELHLKRLAESIRQGRGKGAPC